MVHFILLRVSLTNRERAHDMSESEEGSWQKKKPKKTTVYHFICDYRIFTTIRRT